MSANKSRFRSLWISRRCSTMAMAALLADVTGRKIARARLLYPIARGPMERVRRGRPAIYRIAAAGEALLAWKTDGAQSWPISRSSNSTGDA